MFEVEAKDLLGRVGRLRTRTREVETPALLPVLDPAKTLVVPREMEGMGVEAVMANAYLLKKRFGQRALEEGVHRFLGFSGAVALDSGAYQILRYGSIEEGPREVVVFEEDAAPDIAVILDIPTGSEASWERARYTVEETVRRADEAAAVRRRRDIIWVGPIQGGMHLDLVEHSAREMAKRPYPILALGSPTVVMEAYRYGLLVDMVMAAKRNIPPSTPLHLFGAGHPSMLSLAVAMGCDLFDSAAYALYARDGRYMTEEGTTRLEELDYFPCSCPACTTTKPRETRGMGIGERERFLARHNLYATLQEVRRIKQAVARGELWELLERRARSHPTLLEALIRLSRHTGILERYSPYPKQRGLFHFGRESLGRPELAGFRRRLERFLAGRRLSRCILLVHSGGDRLALSRGEFRRMGAKLSPRTPVFLLIPPLGPVPLELLDVYPVGRIVSPRPLDLETLSDTVGFAERILSGVRREVLVVHDGSEEARALAGMLRRSRRLTVRVGVEPRPRRPPLKGL